MSVADRGGRQLHADLFADGAPVLLRNRRLRLFAGIITGRVSRQCRCLVTWLLGERAGPARDDYTAVGPGRAAHNGRRLTVRFSGPAACDFHLMTCCPPMFFCYLAPRRGDGTHCTLRDLP